jgi:DNA-binding CsgD family transcriptional regulator/tetratricopeptide (TPR) repeat protein
MSDLEAGHAALLRASWREARDRFTAAVALHESPAALDGLGDAARALLDAEGALSAHERGYAVARAAGDDRAAARLAIALVLDCTVFRGPAEASGWLERAASLLEGSPPCEERGMLTYMRGMLALRAGHDPEAAAAFAAEGVAMAREVGAVDGEMACLALEGLARVTAGAVAEGMRRLDEATTAAVAGEVADARLVQIICCHLIDACMRARDFDRATEWCRRVEEIATRFDDVEMFGACRISYGEVLIWRGAWPEAEHTLAAACRDVARAPRRVLDGVVRLAELRRRQGRADDATALLAEADEHPLGILVRGALALDAGDAAGACEAAQRFLRRVGAGDRLERVAALELLVRAGVAAGELGAAEAAAAELEATAAVVGTAPLRASALLARGRLSLADRDAACAALEDAADLLRAAGVRFEAAQARAELADALEAGGRPEAARRAADQARAELAALGLAGDAPPPPAREESAITPREREVLALLAQGRANEEIAAALVVSVRTVESHVANLYAKIGISGRSARAAATAFALSHGLA